MPFESLGVGVRDFSSKIDSGTVRNEIQTETSRSAATALRHADPAMTRGYEMRRAKGEVAQLVGRADGCTL